MECVGLGSLFETTLKTGDVLRDRWEVRKKLGGGGFGQIFLAFDRKKQKEVAIKAEYKKEDSEMVLRMEFDVLLALDGKPHFCKIYGSGEEPKFSFLVMQLCGPSLSEFRKNTPYGYFSFATSLVLMIQCVDAVQHLHYAGYLHRDVKPSNYCMGRYGTAKKMVYLLDFGLARKFVNDSAQIRAPRYACSFRGTVRYASMQIHLRKEMGRVDDLWSLFYMLVEMITGKLPWRNETGKEAVLELKRTNSPRKLIEKLPGKDEFEQIICHQEELKYADEPNYDYIMSTYRDALLAYGFTDSEPFDWEVSHSRCKKGNPFKEILMRNGQRAQTPQSTTSPATSGRTPNATVHV